jgi:hypothetical protein
MTIPTIHTNGTSKDELIKQVTDAAHAVQTAMETLCGAAPNARDYYPQGGGAFARADDEYQLRQIKLKEVFDELVELYNAIQDSGVR